MEYIALHNASHKTIFLQQLLEGLGLVQPNLTSLHCNNNAASCLAEDHIWHPQVKHIRVKYHFVCKLMTNGMLTIMRICSCDNTANILTKPLAWPDFLCLCNYLGLCEPQANESAHAIWGEADKEKPHITCSITIMHLSMDNLTNEYDTITVYSL